MLSAFNARQVPGIRAHSLSSFFQHQATGEADMFHARVHAPIIAPNAILCQGEDAAGAYHLKGEMPNDYGMSTLANIGHAIDRLRIKRGLNKKELSEISGVDAGNLNRIISGKQEATYARMQKIAAALGVAPSTIYRMAETGLTEEEDRKAFLHALIDASGPDQVDAIFRRWPDAGGQRIGASPRQDPAGKQTPPERRSA